MPRSNITPSLPEPSQAESPPPPQARTRSTGSGFLVSPQVVITNYHVIEGCTTLTVRRDGETFAATLRATAERNDLAAITIEKPVGIPPAVRRSALLGEDVVVAGHPLTGVRGVRPDCDKWAGQLSRRLGQ